MQCTECDSSSVKQHCPTPHTMTLFVDDTGCPMRFFIRPGNAKRRFLPVIKLGGGVMCRIQEPGAISLADPKEQSGVAAPGYISVQYILDCVEKNERLDLEGYRLGSTQQERGDSTSSGVCWTGRVGYSREEDDAILRYLKEHSSKESLVRGNKIWQEMERAAVTCHTWQSMKDRYRKHLAGRMEAFQIEDLAATPSNTATHSTKKKSKLEETEAMDTSSDQQVIGSTCTSVENQAVEQEEMKELTNRAEKEEEVLEKESGDETPDLEDLVTGEARDQEEAGAQNVVPGQESVPVAGRAELGQPQSPVSLLSKFMMHKDSFIVDSQTQEGEEGASDPSEAEVEDAIAAVQFLMDEFGVDLACVMQSLLKNSGDFQAVLHYLRTGRRADGRPLWTRHDDLDLQSGDPTTKQALILKYGEENVAKRVAFFNT
ncbi:telomeric repeat-binding factor 2-interacting protein 1-like isoform X2 [Acipenser ruthenus]|uniref:telomeric repeat-binding factor 2-interacting protein 1-like isoform X2 n=1 Tax=Acipenser ruthenus TaxID=7906 RepID=UPI00145B5F5D|nr:telomeric repeat-binding factor 2-interacting protein 1-like isoform X2 [Acipenser ruthenus]